MAGPHLHLGLGLCGDAKLERPYAFWCICLIVASGFAYFAVKLGTEYAKGYSTPFHLLAERPKTILFWTGLWAAPDKEYWMQACPALNCVLSSNRTAPETADAVIFSLDAWNFRFPATRSKEQRYVFFALESVPFRPLPPESAVDLKSKFNFTMTYRLDSDVPYPYGRTSKRKQVIDSESFIRLCPEFKLDRGNLIYRELSGPKSFLSNLSSVVSKKSKLAAWFVSQCGPVSSNRQHFAQQLQEALPNNSVDIYGACGSLKCGSNGDAVCLSMLERDCFFYLSLERAICLDYVTEKLYYILRLQVVPVVLSRAVIRDPLLPAQAVIAADDFNSAADLAAYLSYLSQNHTAYAWHLDWKKRAFESHLFVGMSVASERSVGFCLLCDLLLDAKLPPKVISNISQWWQTDSQCKASYAWQHHENTSDNAVT